MSITRLWLALIVLFALAVRVYRLDGHSLWYDEGTSVALALRDVPTIIQSAAADIHPPLYYLLLHGWVRLVGAGEIAVRLLSVLAGVAVVGLTFLLGRLLFGERVAVLAGFLCVFSPFQVYYSQETRMYIWATLLGGLSTWAFCTALWNAANPFAANLRPAQRQDSSHSRVQMAWLMYILFTTAALYTHYFAATVVLAQDAAIVVMALAQGRNRGRFVRSLAPFAVAQVIVGLLYLPWLPALLGQFSNWPAISEFYSLPALVAKLFPIFSLGLSVEPRAAWLPLLAFGVVLLLGMSPARPASPSPPAPGRAGALLLTISWLLIPVLAMYVLSLRRPLYNPKFLLVATPAFYLLLGRGLVWLANLPKLPNFGQAVAHWPGLILSAMALIVLIAGSLLSLRAYHSDPRYARDNYRGLVQTIQAGQQADDAIILNAPGQTDIFGYYDKGALPVYPLPRQRPLDEQATTGELGRIMAEHGRVWVVYYGDQQADPRRVIETWLQEHAFKASDRWYGNVRLVLYAARQQTAGVMQPVDVRFGPSIHLLGYSLGAAQAAAGDIVPLTLVWQSEATPGERYVVFAHVIDRRDLLWGQRDSEPGSGLRPTTTWRPGEQIQDNIGLPVLAGTPPGDYQIEVGLYRPDNGQRLPIVDQSGASLGDRILLGPLSIIRPLGAPPLDALAVHKPAAQSFGALRLLGYNLSRLGSDSFSNEFAAGDIVHLTLFWQATAHPLPDMTTYIQVVDQRGRPVLQSSGQPGGEAYPTSSWTAGDVVRDQYRLPLPGFAAGQYRLMIEVRGANGGRLGATTVVITVK